MMREILFRGKCVDNGKWVYGYLSSKRTIGVFSLIGNFDEYIVDPNTVGQYTGLKDKNGKKIFEDDILIWDEKEWGYEPHIEVAEWNYDLFCMRYNDWKEFCEIIGNIYENPELIKGKGEG